MRRLGPHLVQTYLEIDARSLGLFRIVFGSTMLLDLWLRSHAVTYWYSSKGLLPAATLLASPPAPRMFSLFLLTSSEGQVRFGMALCAIVFALFTIGYRTRLMQLLSFLCLTSLNARLLLLEVGGDMVMNLLCLWTLFLPLGQRFSFDSLRASLASRQERTAADLVDRRAMRVGAPRVRSLAVLALLLQFTLVYTFNTIHKNGSTWLDGSAVHLTLHQDRLVTVAGVWLREHAPSSLLALLTYLTLAVEGSGALLIASPVAVHITRGLAILLLPALHLGFAACLNLGIFSYSMVAFFPLLVHERHWSWLRAALTRVHRPQVVLFDAGCGICFQCARLLARLDVLDRTRIVSSQDREARPPGVDDAMVEVTLVTHDPERGVVHTRSDAVASALRSVPLGFVAWAVLKLPGLSLAWRALYDRVAQNRIAISQFFGLAACGIAPPSAAGPSPAPPPSDFQRFGQRLRGAAREAGVALFMLASLGEIVNVNPSVPDWMRYQQPDVLQALIEYPRLLQGWRMFAPDAPRQDYNITVEGRTADGRIVDPYNEAASRHATVPFTSIPTRLGQDQFFTSYSLYVPRRNFRPYRAAFQAWILRYPERTGRPEDRIVSFEAYRLSDVSPPLGKLKPTNFRKIIFMRYPR